MEDFLFPVSQYSMCQRMISLAFVKAEKKERSQLLFHYLCHFFINKEAFCFFLRLELRLTGHRGEWGFVRREVVIHTSPEPTRKTGNSAMQGLSHSSAGPAESRCNVCCPVDLGKPEVSTDPACWFNV